MADFVPPPGPPPPKVPEGWKAQWNEQYKEWFYVNIHTKQSQWDKPTQPAYPSNQDTAPSGAPPGYAGSDAFSNVSDKKSNPYDDPRGAGSASPNNIDEDAKLAAKLQAEEDAQAQKSRGNAYQDYVNTPLPAQNSQAQLPPREEKRGLFSKLLGGGKSNQQQPHYGQQGYGGSGYPQQGGYPPQQGYPPQGGYGGGYPPQGYGGGYPPQGGYGGYPAQGGYGGYPPQGYAQQAPPKKSGGLGTAGGAALGLGGGLIGGMLLEDAIQDHGQSEYNQGYNQGYDQGNGGDNGVDNGGDNGGGDGGGDYGGGDDGGGGGGDF